ncbi:hemolysin secretion protein D [Psychrosphaera saromensis]|nr:efflux RND transporter periplasmic adaptor subunit [Psychrosphaera saromensis]GHB74437.1 hemolysin secretion protein D [Psychrosphaera saromensis]GLQ12595.1 hemolysin secretion protein D [Psychrosphaera saromensis]
MTDNKKASIKSMTTNTFRLSALVATLAILSACGGNKDDAQQVKPIQTVKLAVVSNIPEESQMSFPAEVTAVKTINMSFEVTGRLSEVHLRTASQVKKGQLLAQIDPIPFQRQVKEAKARFNQAELDLKRIKSTLSKGVASQSQLDSAETAFELAEIMLNNAKQNLSYTRLTAPFDAQVSERLVENDSYVKAGDTIAKLQDISQLYFNINIPERLLSAYKTGSLIKATAHSLSAPDKEYELEYVEHSTMPDPVTQTYKVVFAAHSAPKQRLTPGARAIVKLVANQQRSMSELIIPFTAINGNKAKGFNVWVFDEKTKQVSNKQIQVLKVEKGYAIISGDIQKGNFVVAAGTTKMQEGLVVKPYTAER